MNSRHTERALDFVFALLLGILGALLLVHWLTPCPEGVLC
jgi:hypothetical protein